MTIQIEYEAKERFPFDYEELLRRVVTESCEYMACPYEAEVTIVITDNKGIQEVNREYRKIDMPTDVLSFPMAEYEVPGDFSFLEREPAENFNPDTGELLLGDIMLNYDRVVSQAESYGHSLKRELAFLVVHSMLHLFGYDHMKQEERLLMEEKQKALMQRLRISR